MFALVQFSDMSLRVCPLKSVKRDQSNKTTLKFLGISYEVIILTKHHDINLLNGIKLDIEGKGLQIKIQPTNFKTINLTIDENSIETIATASNSGIIDNELSNRNIPEHVRAKKLSFPKKDFSKQIDKKANSTVRRCLFSSLPKPISQNVQDSQTICSNIELNCDMSSLPIYNIVENEDGVVTTTTTSMIPLLESGISTTDANIDLPIGQDDGNDWIDVTGSYSTSAEPVILEGLKTDSDPEMGNDSMQITKSINIQSIYTRNSNAALTSGNRCPSSTLAEHSKPKKCHTESKKNNDVSHRSEKYHSYQHSTAEKSDMELKKNSDMIHRGSKKYPCYGKSTPEKSDTELKNNDVIHRRGEKNHSCYFCGFLSKNLRKHWRSKHSHEPLFQKALKEAESHSGKYHRAFEQLRKLGDEKYNLQNQDIPDIVVRNSGRPEAVYITCPKCKGFYVTKNYYRHRRVFCKSSESQSPTSIIGKARITNRISENAHPLLVSHIFPYLTKKEHQDVLFKDPVAIILGNVLCMEQLSKPDPGDLYVYVSGQLRLLADIFNISKKMDPSIEEIDDMFFVHRYENVLNAVRVRGSFENGVFKHPYPALQSCILLSKLCKRLKSIALSEHKEDLYQRYNRYEILLKDQQNTNITKLASAAMVAHRRNKCESLPSTAQVKSLMEILENEFDFALNAAKINFNPFTYRKLAYAIMARIMVMNRRRPGDVHKSTIAEFRNLSKADEGFLSTLDENQRKIAANFCRYVTRGKLNKTMPNLITVKMADAISLLLEHRSEVGIMEDNIYVFANNSSKRAKFFRADDALKEICKSHGISYQEVTSTKLRKHFATATTNLDQNTQTLISDFMGHSFSVHKNIYQVKQTQTDVSVIGRILLDSSGIYYGTQPETVQITRDHSVLTGDAERALLEDRVDKPDIHSCDTLEEPSSYVINRSPIIEFNSNNDDETFENYELDNEQHMEYDSSFDSDWSPEDADDSESEIEMTRKPNKNSEEQKTFYPTKKKYKFPCNVQTYRSICSQKTMCNRTWRTPQKKMARKIFRDYIQNDDTPSIQTIQDILTSQKVDFQKSLLQIQAWVTAEIMRKNSGNSVARWTTPEKFKLREHFKKYYLSAENSVGRFFYPPFHELQNAMETIPELKNRTPAALKSKLQNEFKNWEHIKKSHLTLGA